MFRQKRKRSLCKSGTVEAENLVAELPPIFEINVCRAINEHFTQAA